MLNCKETTLQIHSILKEVLFIANSGKLRSQNKNKQQLKDSLTESVDKLSSFSDLYFICVIVGTLLWKETNSVKQSKSHNFSFNRLCRILFTWKDISSNVFCYVKLKWKNQWLINMKRLSKTMIKWCIFYFLTIAILSILLSWLWFIIHIMRKRKCYFYRFYSLIFHFRRSHFVAYSFFFFCEIVTLFCYIFSSQHFSHYNSKEYFYLIIRYLDYINYQILRERKRKRSISFNLDESFHLSKQHN